MAKVTAQKKSYLIPSLAIVLVLSLSLFAYVRYLNQKNNVSQTPPTNSSELVQIIEPIALPKPVLTGKLSVEAALHARRSVRNFLETKATINQVSQLLWAAQGITTDWGGRTAPSAKSAYPLSVYLVASNVEGLNPGIYRYNPGEREVAHTLILTLPGDHKSELATAIGQNSAVEAPNLLLITGNMAKMAKAFDNKRVDENVYLEVGHAAQNIYLEAESLGLGTVTLAGFDGAKVRDAARIPSDETVIYVLPFGLPKE